MKVPMGAIAFLAIATAVAMPASAQDEAAARAACNTYAEMKNGGALSASPQLDPRLPGPSNRGIQAPGTGVSGNLAQSDPAFRQAFQECMAKLHNEPMPSASPRLDAPPLSRLGTPGIQAPGTGSTDTSDGVRR